MELWELTARESIRDTIAHYNWSGDAFRLDQLAAAFCEDGVLELRGRETFQGRDAIVAFLSGITEAQGDGARHQTGGAKRIVRHNVTNIRFVEVSQERARLESYFTVVTEIGLDHYGRYRDTFVPVGDAWLIQHRFVSTDWHAPESTMAQPFVDD